MAVSYTFLRNRVDALSNAVKDNALLIEQLLRNDAKNFKIKQSKGFRSPIGNPTSECEDASHLAIKLTREIQNRNSRISIIDWFDDLSELGSILYDVGLKKEARWIWQFEYRILILLASKEGSEEGRNVDSRLACCLHNLAVSYSYEGRYKEAILLAERAVEIRRRLGEPFISFLADSLSLLSGCFRHVRQFWKAEKFIQESIDLIRELAFNDPSQYGWQLARRLNDIADLYFDLGKCQEAIDYSREAFQWLSKSSPQFKVEFPYDYCEAQWLTALAYRKFGNSEKATEFGREATTIFNKLIGERPHYYINDRRDLLSIWLYDIGRRQDAIHDLEKRLTIYCSVEPTSTVQKGFATILYKRAEYLYREDMLPDALNAISQVIDVRRHLLEEDESNDCSLKELLDAFKLHCSCLISLRRPFDAMKTIETTLNLLWPSLIEVGRSAQSGIFEDLAQKESMIKKLQSNGNACNLKKYKVLSTIDNAILFWRQRECSSSNLINLLELRFNILKVMEKPDVDFLIIKETIDWYRCKLDSDIVKGSLGSLIKLLSSSAKFLEQWGSVDSSLIFLKDAFKYVKFNIDFSFYDIINLKDRLVSNLIRRNKQSMAVEALNMFEGALRPIIDGKTRYSGHCLADILTTRSRCYFDLHRFVEALQDAKEAVEIHRDVVSEYKDHQVFNDHLANALHAHARVLVALNDFDGALKSVEEAMQLDEKFHIWPFKDTVIELRAEILNRLESSVEVQDVVQDVDDTENEGWIGEMYTLMI